MEEIPNSQLIHKNLFERREEGKDIYELMQRTQREEYMNEEGCPVFLIPISWFMKWKRHVFFHELTEDDEEGMMADDDSKTGYDFFPGKIEVSELLEVVPNLLYDPDPVKEYTNFVLKKGMENGKDFFILGKSSAKYLYEKYGGTELKRIIVSINDDNQLTQVEYYLKQLNLLIFPQTIIPNEDGQALQMKIQICRKETANDLKDKIIRSLKHISGNESAISKQSKIKLWKIEQKIEEIAEKLSDQYLNVKPNENIILKLKSFDTFVNLEESEISENDTIIVEFSNSQNKFIFKTSEVTTKKNFEACAKCGKTDNLSLCQCRQIKYCSSDCQRQHRNKHKQECEKMVSEINQFNSVMKKCGVSGAKKIGQGSKQGLTGLQNLGNTCFMNSSIQCLSNIPELTNYMITNSFVKDLNVKNPLGTGGLLASSYAELMKEIWVGNHNYVSAWDLKKIVGQVAPQFYGYQQQDSQELLSYLLDGIHEDVNRIKTKPIVDQVESDGSNVEECAKKTWDNYLKRNSSIISDLMVGQFKSTLVCPACNRISITFDPFMSVSLPLNSGSQSVSFSMYFVNRDPKALVYKMVLQLQLQDTAMDLIAKLSEKLQIDKNQIEINIIKDYRPVETVEMDASIKYLRDHDGLIFGYELMNEKFDYEALQAKKQIKAKISIDKQFPGMQKKRFTYQRILFNDADAPFAQFHIQIYQLLRPFIANFIQKAQIEGDPISFNIDEDLSEEDLVELQKEYEQLLQANKKPFTIHFAVGDKLYELPYDAESSFEKKYNLVKQLITVEMIVVLSDNLKTEYMKLNRCTEFQEKSTQTQSKSNAMSIYECLDLFTKEEILDKGNEWYCNKCKDHMRASKKMELYKLPNILILHLKRFKTNKIFNIGSSYFSGGSQKINVFVDFPGPDEELDMSNYCIGPQKNQKVLYNLIGVSNHYGGLGGGHYTAFAKNPINNKWYEFNDSNVSAANKRDVVSDAAYVLFYKLKTE